MAAIDFKWVQPLVVLAGILISFGAATYTIATNRKIARQKATMDLIEGSESKDHYQRLYRTYRQYRSDPAFRKLVDDAADDAAKTQRQLCFDFLNHYELVAIGIRRGILEEEFYRMWMEYTLVRDWRAGQDLVKAAREPPAAGITGDRVAYCHLEALALKWAPHTDDATRIPWYRTPSAWT